MTENREILNEAEVDFLLAGTNQETDAPAPAIDDGDLTATMRGDLDQISLADIFQTLAMSKMEGVLRVRNPLEERQIYCRDGHVRILVPPRVTARRLGQRLVHAGLLQAEQLRAALLLQRRQKVQLGQLLVREGIVAQAQIDEIVEMQVAEDLFALFTWKHGTFEFFKLEPGNGRLQTQFHLCAEYEVSSLLLEVARRSDEWESILDTIASLDEVPLRIAEPADEGALEDVHRAVLAGTDTQTTYRQIADGTTFGLFEVARAARDLVRGGILANVADDDLALVATRRAEEGESKHAVVLLQTLRDRPGERTLAVIQRMASVLEQIGERRFASSLLLEAAQQADRAEDALALARSARDLVPYDPGVLSFLRTVLVAHDAADSPELEQCTIDLLDALIDGDLIPTALEIVEDARRTGTVQPQILAREAKARQRGRDVIGATQVLVELAELYESRNERPKAIEAYEALLRLDRSRRDIQRIVSQLRRTRAGRIIRVVAALLVLALVGGMGVVWYQQWTFEQSVQLATQEVDSLLEQGDRPAARERLEHWRERLGACEPIEDLASRIAFADAAERTRIAKLKRARINEQLTAAAEALGRGDLQEALDLYGRIRTQDEMAAEVDEVVATRLDAVMARIQQTAKSLDNRLPPDPDQLYDRKDLTVNLAELQANCPPVVLRSFRALHAMHGQRELPEFLSPDTLGHITTVLTESRPNLERAEHLAAAYTKALQRNETQRRLDPMFKAAVAKEAAHDFAGALELYRELEKEQSGDAELRAHFRDRVTRNATIVQLLGELSAATQAGDFGTATQHLRALRLSFPEVPFDQLVRLPLTVRSEPLGATVVCNGKEVGRTPVLLARVPADETRLAVSMDGFRGAEQVVDGDGTDTWTARLVLLPDAALQHGSAIDAPPLRLPDGSLVFVDRGGNVVSLPADLSRATWSFATGDLSGWLTWPLGDGAQVVVGSLDGQLRALASADGALAWSLPDLPTEVMPALSERMLLLATTDARLHAIDLAARRRQSVELPEPAHGALFVHHGRVLVVGSRGTVTAWESPDLRPSWRRALPELPSPHAVLVEDVLVVADEAGHVRALDAGTGRLRWQHDLGATTLGALAASQSTVFLAATNQVVRIAVATGELLPPFAPDAGDWAGAPTVAGQRLILPLRSGSLQVLDATDGQPLYRLDGRKDSRVFVDGERVFVCQRNHLLQRYSRLR